MKARKRHSEKQRKREIINFSLKKKNLVHRSIFSSEYDMNKINKVNRMME